MSKKMKSKNSPLTPSSSKDSKSSTNKKTTSKKNSANAAKSKAVISKKSDQTVIASKPPILTPAQQTAQTISQKPFKIKLLVAYQYALDLIGLNAGAIFIVSGIFVATSLILNLLDRYYFHNSIMINLINATIIFLISIGSMIYYNNLLKGHKPKINSLWKSWQKVIPTFLVNVISFFLTALSFLPFLLLGLIMFFFALASLDILKIADLLIRLQFNQALELMINNGQHSLNWIIAMLVVYAIGGIVSLIVSLNFVFTTIIITTQNESRIGSTISYSTHLSKGNKWKLFWLNTFNLLINILGLAFFGLGAFFTIPLTTIAALVTYHQAQGTVDQLPIVSKKSTSKK